MVASKRRLSEVDEGGVSPDEKRTQANKAVPTNKTMPTDYSFVRPAPDGHIKLASFNVNSLSAACKKGFKEYLAAESPDVICLQETKANQPMAFLVGRDRFPHQYWHCSTSKKGYAGTAVFSKIKPLRVTYGMGDRASDTEGRVITLEFGSFFFVGCYVPNAGEKLVRLDRRLEWDRSMNAYLGSLEASKPVIYAGDLNVAHHPIDLARPDTNKRSAGFTIEERDSFSEILRGQGDVPRIDTFRHLYPSAGAEAYTYFGYRANCRANGVGWRLDYFVVSQPLLPRVSDVIVRNECYGASDHVPLVLILKKEPGDDAAESSKKSCGSGIEPEAEAAEAASS